MAIPTAEADRIPDATTSTPRGAQNSNMATAPRKPLPPGSPRLISDHDSKLQNVYGPLGYLKELVTRFNTDQCASWAASLSFFALLSIAPVLLCGLAVLGFLIHDPHEASLHVQEIIKNFVPGDYGNATARDIVAEMNIEKSASTLIDNRGIAGVIGLFSLFWAALQIFVNAIAPMNAAFRATEKRNWFVMRLNALGLLFVTGLLFLLSLIPSSVFPLIDNLPWLRHFNDTSEALVMTVVNVASLILAIIINATMFATIYRYLPSPSARVSWKAAGFAGLIIAALWEAAKRGFALYLSHFANYNKLYGSLGGLVALIFWIYYSSMILLLGAEIAGLFQDADHAKQRSTAA